MDGGEWPLAFGPQEWGYRVHCPRSPSGIAVVGDSATFATAGQGRIGEIVPIDDGVRVRVLGPGETITITGTAPAPVTATVRTATASAEANVVTGAGGRFDVDVAVGTTGWAVLDVVV